ncbi:MAG: SDR family oxidoreductase, partial [Bdellovibrionales bacterium]|nr:SDR family oxidoreductase [Bdellovibrionales bacterium]
MKVLILGAGGMLGHKMAMKLGNSFEIFTATRQSLSQYTNFALFDPKRHIENLDVGDEVKLLGTLDQHQPEAVINCIGVTTRKLPAGQSHLVIRLNSLLPHVLSSWCQRNQSRLIHFSTDCVFSGDKGNYSEEDLTDARDLYGLSKILGEVKDPPALTIRSSIIGRELLHKTELVEWFLSQRGRTVKGFSNVYYSGVTTNYMAYLVEHILKNHQDLSGLYQLASPRISKMDLLQLINQEFGLGIEIDSDPTYRSDKSLDGSRLAKILNDSEKPEW